MIYNFIDFILIVQKQLSMAAPPNLFDFLLQANPVPTGRQSFNIKSSSTPQNLPLNVTSLNRTQPSPVVQPLQPIQLQPLQPIQSSPVQQLQPIQSSPVVQPLQPIQSSPVVQQLQPIKVQQLQPIKVQPLQPIQIQSLTPIQPQPLQPIQIQSLNPIQVRSLKSEPVQPLEVAREEKEWRTLDIRDMILSDDDPMMAYRKREEDEKTSVPWGQRKLALSLIQFLTIYWDPVKTPNPILVYAGAAPGTNIEFVMKNFFQKFTSYLYDPSEMKVVPDEKMHVRKQFFTIDTANEWAGRNDVFFYSDMRSRAYSLKKDSVENEAAVLKDMKLQQDAVRIMKPVASMLKLRPPYPNPGETERYIEYLDGTVYFGIWAPQTSTETRLVVTEYKTKMWEIVKYESQLFYFNLHIREQVNFYNPLVDIDDPQATQPVDYPELMNDFDSIAEVKVWSDYLFKIAGKAAVTKITVTGLSRALTKAVNKNLDISKWPTLSRLREDTKMIKRHFVQNQED
jgi:hypothetical protein